MTVAAGAIGADASSEFGMNLVELDLDSGGGHVHLFKYSRLNGEWCRHSDELPTKVKDGKWPIQIKAIPRQTHAAVTHEADLSSTATPSLTARSPRPEYYVARNVRFFDSKLHVASGPERGDLDVDDEAEGSEASEWRRRGERAAHPTGDSPLTFHEVVKHHLGKGYHHYAVVLIGSEGMGKSFEVDELIFQLADTCPQNTRCIKFDCRYVSAHTTAEMFWSEANGGSTLADAEKEIKVGHRFILVLDGYDELLSGTHNAFREIRIRFERLALSSKGLLVVTSRRSDDVLLEFPMGYFYELLPFDRASIKQYLSERPELIAVVEHSRLPTAIFKLLQVPFFLYALSKLRPKDVEELKVPLLTRAELLRLYLQALLTREKKKVYSNDADEQTKSHVIKSEALLCALAWNVTSTKNYTADAVGDKNIKDLAVLFDVNAPTVTFCRDVIRCYFVAKLIAEELTLSATNRAKFQRVMRRPWGSATGTDESNFLSETDRLLIVSLLVEIANTTGDASHNIVDAVWKYDPILACFAARGRRHLRSRANNLRKHGWNLFENYVCKLLLGEDASAEAAEIQNERLVSPEEFLLFRLRDENLQYVATKQALDCIRNNLERSPEPLGDLVTALGCKLAFGDTPEGCTWQLLEFAYGLCGMFDSEGYQSIDALETDFDTFTAARVAPTAASLTISVVCRLAKALRATPITDDENRGKLGKLLAKILEWLDGASENFSRIDARQADRLFDNKVTTAPESGLVHRSLSNRMLSDPATRALWLKSPLRGEQRDILEKETHEDVGTSFVSALLTPHKMFQVLAAKTFLPTNDAKVTAWVGYWRPRMVIGELGRAAKLGLELGDIESLPVLQKSFGWMTGRDAVRLNTWLGDSKNALLRFSSEHKQYWTANSSLRELRDLLRHGLIERNDEKLFADAVDRLTRKCSPVFLRSLLIEDPKVIKTPDIAPPILSDWNAKAEHRPDIYLVCFDLDMKQLTDDKIPDKVRDNVLDSVVTR